MSNRMKKLPASKRRIVRVTVTLLPLEHEALKRRAASTGATASSTVRVVLLKDLFAAANQKVQEPVSP